VNSFVSLAHAGFYTGSPCHRLTTMSALKVLQCGDPSGTGTGGPPYRFANENATQTFHRGDVAMANAGSDATNGSQFFLVAADTQPLGNGYSLFGTITSGLDVLDREEQAGASGQSPDDGSPKLPISLRTVTITSG
jgi:peptidyl-prolyl cis-trans isomerase B (cyclophilin B)